MQKILLNADNIAIHFKYSGRITFYYIASKDMTTIEELKAIFEGVRKDILEKTESVDSLKKVLTLYEAYNSGPDTFITDSKVKSYFFDDFSTDLIQCLSNLPALTKPEVFLVGGHESH